jgi:hypothetical protein
MHHSVPMTALPTAAPPTLPLARAPMLTLLRFLLLAEAVAGLALAIYLSVVAGDASVDAETSLRFAAGGAFVFAILAAVASRGVRRRRGWAWTLSAILQVVLAIGTGVAVMTAEWHPAYLAGFAVATVLMTVLSAPSVREALGQA